MRTILLLCLSLIAVNALPFDAQLLEAQKFNGTNWVVLVAGSNEWYNYRHQADIYHAYQIVRSHGIPESNVIVFHYDDLANNAQNPTPGIVINKPGGKDVYHGVPKDFVGADVTPKNFLAVLQGDKTLEAQGKKVVKSGPNDHIFVYFADHGATDLIAFPSEYLYGEDLNKVLKSLYDNKRYSKLVFYLEACESGSMFSSLLPKDINIYATTASNPTESSYACYYDATRETYLGDVYSVNWMENSDLKTYSKESLVQQFEVVLKETNTSHVEEYGDLSLGKLPLTQFQGAKVSEQLIGGDENVVQLNAVDSGDVPIHIVLNKIKNAVEPKLKRKFQLEYNSLVRGRDYMINQLSRFAEQELGLDYQQIQILLSNKQEVVHKSCYRQFVDTFHRDCLNLNQHPFVLRKLHVFGNACELLHRQNGFSNLSQVVESLTSYCVQNKVDQYPEPIL